MAEKKENKDLKIIKVKNGFMVFVGNNSEVYLELEKTYVFDCADMLGAFVKNFYNDDIEGYFI